MVELKSIGNNASLNHSYHMLILRETPIFISCRDCESAGLSVWMSLDTAKYISTTVKKVCLSACYVFSTYGQQSIMENLADNGLGLFVWWFRFSSFFGLPILPHAQYGPYYVTVLFWHGDGRLLSWFVFIRIRNTKPWNHLHSYTVVLWTKIVVELMFLYSRLQR